MAEEKLVVEEAERESQFTFRNIGKSIVRFKFWIIGASVLGMVGGYLGFRFGLNASREKMVSSFGYDINANPKVVLNDEKTTDADRANQTLYLSDGSIFSFTDVISETRLKAVQEAKKDEFGKINVSKMVKEGGIQITRASYTESTTGKTIFEYPARYTITVSRNYFSSQQQAKNYIEAVINYELAVAEAANNNYEVEDYLSNVNASNYGLYVQNLKKQYAAIDECYTDLLKQFSTSSIADSKGSSLNKVYSTFSAEYASGANSTIIDKYDGDLYNDHLVDYSSVTLESLTQQANSYIENLRSNLITLQTYQTQLDKLTGSDLIINGASEITEEIVRLNKLILESGEQNNFYTKEIINLGYTVATPVTLDNISSITYAGDGAKGVIQSFKADTQAWKDACDAFKLKLVETAGQLKQDRTTVGDVYGYVNNKYNNQVNFYTAGVAKLEGHVSAFIGAAVGLVAGFVLASLVCTFVYLAKKEKEEKE